MGCCFSRENEKKPLIESAAPLGKTNPPSSSTTFPPVATANATQQKQLVGQMINLREPQMAQQQQQPQQPQQQPSGKKIPIPSIETLINDVRSKWEKPISALPVAIDFPRLAKMTKLFNEQGELQLRLTDEGTASSSSSSSEPSGAEGGSQPSVERLIYGILLSLAIHLKDTQSHDVTRDKYWTYLRENLQVDGEIKREFEMFLKNCLTEDSKVAHVLKTINQGVLAPAVISLKMALPTLPFKDFRNSWRIEVVITDESVLVIHKRREQSFNSPPDMKFEFTWDFCIVFDSQASFIREAKIRITELAFGEKVTDPNKSKITAEMKRFNLLADNCLFTTLPA